MPSSGTSSSSSPSSPNWMTTNSKTSAGELSSTRNTAAQPEREDPSLGDLHRPIYIPRMHRDRWRKAQEGEDPYSTAASTSVGRSYATSRAARNAREPVSDLLEEGEGKTQSLRGRPPRKQDDDGGGKRKRTRDEAGIWSSSTSSSTSSMQQQRGGDGFRAERRDGAPERSLPDHGGEAGALASADEFFAGNSHYYSFQKTDAGSADEIEVEGGYGGYSWSGDGKRTATDTSTRGAQQLNLPLSRGQSVQDFMDDQDHEEWGGPAGIRQEFLESAGDAKGAATAAARTTATAARTTCTVAAASAADLFAIRFRPGVGERLLRALGWRGGAAGSSAYVPEEQSDYCAYGVRTTGRSTTGPAPGGSEPRWQQGLLRKVELGQVEVRIPPPKRDLFGLGYEPLTAAPKKHARGQRSQLRSSAADVYRVSTALGHRREEEDEDGDEEAERLRSSYVSRESPDHWIGSRTAGGFALRDDEDDAYDDGVASDRRTDGAGKVRVNREAFDTELDLGDDDSSIDEQAGMKRNRKEQVTVSGHRSKVGGSTHSGVGGLFSSWVGPASAPSHETGGWPGAGASDGRPVLPGFVLSVAGVTASARFRGPDVPVDFDAVPHVFGPREHPLVLQALLHAERLQLGSSVHRNALPWTAAGLAKRALERRDALAPPSLPPRGPTSTKHAAFSGISRAMNDRFAAASSRSSSFDPSTAIAESTLNGAANPTHFDEPAHSRRLEVSRTYAAFGPAPLLCTRFQVPVPSRTGELSTARAIASHRSKEEAFFLDEILSRLPAAKCGKGGDLSANHPGSILLPPTQGDLVEVLNNQVPLRPPDEERPSALVFQSIFEPRDDEAEGFTGAEGPAASASDEHSSRRVVHAPAVALPHPPKILSKLSRSGDEGVEGSEPNGLQASTDDDDDGQIQRRLSSRRQRGNQSRSDSESSASEDGSSSRAKLNRKRSSKKTKRRDERRDKKKHKRKSRLRSGD